jgi:hypothetical protein
MIAFSRRTLWIGVVALILVGVAVCLVEALRTRKVVEDLTDSPVPDPRLTYDGPFQNVRPAVQYVGDATCSDCHHDIVASYKKHPMGRSLTPTASFVGRQRFDKAVNNPFEAFGLHFSVRRRGDEVFHEVARLDAKGEPVCAVKLRADYVIGSGARGHSYLSDRDGFVYQTPISWFSQKAIWDLSPGFSERIFGGRVVRVDCLYCHVNQVEAVANTVNRYREPLFRGHAIGCERCHGPGEIHVRDRSLFEQVAGGKDTSIVNPRHLPHALREAVCQQCHLEGEKRVLRRGRDPFDFRPGLPLETVFSVFVRPEEEGAEFKAVTHVEQMYLSRCFQVGQGAARMGCISCHNPHEHVGPERRFAYYREKCLQCHDGASPAKKTCAEPAARRLAANQDSCIDCHMRPYSASDIVHTAATDHRILRRRGEVSIGRGPSPSTDGLPLTPFHPRPDPHDSDLRRDLGMAMAALLDVRKLNFIYVNPTLDLLDEAVKKFPQDLVAREARARLLASQHRPTDALAGFQTVLAADPNREGSLAAAAALSAELGDNKESAALWRRAVEANPWNPDYRRGLAAVLIRLGDWDAAAPHARAWKELSPFLSDAHRTWRDVLLRQGKRAEADAEQAVLRALQNP